MTPIRNTFRVEEFFENYAFVFNRALLAPEGWVDETTDFFADCFIAASPAGVNCGKNDASFRQVIPGGYERYRTMGICAMKIVSQKITFLDDYHVMDRVLWTADYEKQDKKGSVSFEVVYLVQTRLVDYKIFGWITADEEKALKQVGLME